MRRRDVPTAILASAAGAALMSAKAQAQACTLPCYPQTDPERTAGVTPANYAYVPDIPVIDARRHGLSPSASASANTTALSNALAVAASAGGGTVRIGAGIFNFNGTLIIPSNVQLIGETMGFGVYSSTVLRYVGNGRALQIDGYYSRLADFTLKQAASGTVGIYLNATQTMIERVTVTPDLNTGFSTAGIQIDVTATTFTHLLRRCYVYGNGIGVDVSRGNNIVLDQCFLESNGTNVRVGATAAVSNFVITNGSVIELFGDGRAAESNNSICVDVMNCANFVCRDSYFEVNGAAGVAASAQRAIRLSTVRAAYISGNYFFGGNVFVNAAKAAINIASSAARAIDISGNEFASFNTAGVEATSTGSLTQALFGANNASTNTPFVYDDRWTPTLTLGGASSSGAAYAGNGQVGRWQRVGNRIHASCYMQLTSKGVGSGAVRIVGLPASADPANNLDSIGKLAVANCGGAIAGSLSSYVQNNTASIRLYYNGNGTLTSFLDTDINNSAQFWIGVDYPITS